MFLTRISVNHPVFATMVILAVTVLGIFSYQRLSVEEFPNIDFPVVVVQTTYAGAAPEAVASDISEPIEKAVNTINGIDQLTSRSYQNLSVVIIQFNLDVDGAEAAQEVRDKVASVEGSLPDGAERPRIGRFDPSAQPIMSIAVTADGLPLRDLTALAEDTIVPRLSVIEGVGEASVVGGVTRQLNILLDRDRMEALGVTVNEVTAAIRAQNQDLPAGAVTSGNSATSLQVEGRIADPEGFGGIVVARRGGEPVTLDQVAAIEDGQSDDDSRAQLNGTQALAVDVVKIEGANTIAVAEGVRATLAELTAGELPAGVHLQIVRDNSTAIAASVEDVQSTLIEGAVLAVLIVFLFLNSWRSTVITGLTLPVSVIGTVTVIAALGFTLNTMTLMALSLAIGILIDDAIVVRENITRHLAMGKSHRRAALEGTNEIGLAVLATTLSIVAVFLPVAFMGGIIGRFFLQFGVTVAVAVLLSLFVSFTLDPMLSSVWYDPASSPNARRGFVGRLIGRFDRGFERLTGVYRRILGFSLRHRILTLATAAVLFVGSLAMVGVIGVEFVPQSDRGELTVSVETAVGSSTDYTAAKVRQVEAALHEFPEVALTYATVNSGSSQGSNRGSIHVGLTDAETRTRSAQALQAPIRARMAAIPGAKVTVGQEGIGGGSTPIQISLLGASEQRLQQLSDELVEKLAAVPGAADVESSLSDETPTIAIRLRDEVASDLGVTVADVAEVLQPLLAGSTVTTWESPDGDDYDVVLRLPEGQRDDLAGLGDLMISTVASGGTTVAVPLSQVADITASTGPSEVTREDLSRQVQITANVSGRSVGEVSADMQKVAEAVALPPGYRILFGGETQNMNESLGYAGSALLMAVLFIYFVLASQFGSFLQPLAIMASLPLSLIGVLLGLLLTGSTLNMFSAIGFIMLMGLVTKNAILLVDFANQQRKAGLPLKDALLAAGSVRLRPIVMTTLAMIFGMLPLALGLGAGGEQRAPMAHAVIGGLISSTLLTLVVVPVLLTYLDGLGARIRRLFPKGPDEEASGERNVLALSRGR